MRLNKLKNLEKQKKQPLRVPLMTEKSGEYFFLFENNPSDSSYGNSQPRASVLCGRGSQSAVDRPLKKIPIIAAWLLIRPPHRNSVPIHVVPFPPPRCTAWLAALHPIPRERVVLDDCGQASSGVGVVAIGPPPMGVGLGHEQAL
jgi:hypothetical protein